MVLYYSRQSWVRPTTLPRMAASSQYCMTMCPPPAALERRPSELSSPPLALIRTLLAHTAAVQPHRFLGAHISALVRGCYRAVFYRTQPMAGLPCFLARLGYAWSAQSAVAQSPGKSELSSAGHHLPAKTAAAPYVAGNETSRYCGVSRRVLSTVSMSHSGGFFNEHCIFRDQSNQQKHFKTPATEVS